MFEAQAYCFQFFFPTPHDITRGWQFSDLHGHDYSISSDS